jgi:hypothetical protein
MIGVEIDQAYLIPISDLREICAELTQENYSYVVESDDKHVTIFFNDNGDDDLNSLAFAFPVVADLTAAFRLLGADPARLDEGYLVCLHVYTHKQTRRGLCLAGDEVKLDADDWFKFWTPLEALLFKELSRTNPTR